MKPVLDIQKRNAVLTTMARLLQEKRKSVLDANAIDLETYAGEDIAMRERLIVDGGKIAGMVKSLTELAAQEDPLGKVRFEFTHENGMHVTNRTAPFGTILIIYESRPDVTIEAAGIAFKSGNKILLKGGKESLNSNVALLKLWHEAFGEHDASFDWVTYLQFNRKEIQSFLENPTQKIDLIVPRGGERLIAFVKQHATCPVMVSGRGNNFVYVDHEADQQTAIDIIINAKTTKISACNALDKVIIASHFPEKQQFLQQLTQELKKSGVKIFVDGNLQGLEGTIPIVNEQIWYEEFLEYKIVLGQVEGVEEAVNKINKYSGGHSASIVTKNSKTAAYFMNGVDCAAVYHNVSTRFTDGGQFGLGGELAISTDKLHQRGPIGLQHLVTNKWYVEGVGQIRT